MSEEMHEENWKCIIGVYDRKAQTYLNIVSVVNLDVAKRLFYDLLHNGDSVFAMHPEDYDLYLLGKWCEDSGRIVPENIPWIVQNGVKKED